MSEGVLGADFRYTDVWVSMGEPLETWAKRIPLLTPYQVDASAMAATGKVGTKFLLCRPAVHDRSTILGQRLYEQSGVDGAEVTDEVFTSPASIVFDQAENRTHTIKAVTVNALAG